MTRAEFAGVMHYISLAINKPLSADSAEVYFDLLGDLPIAVLKLAAKRVCLEHRWANFPTVAELREAAAATQRGEVSALSAAEAWALAWRAIGRIDLEIDGSVERAFKGLPAVVVDALNALGIANLCYGKEPVAVIRAQFVKAFEAIAARQKREALLPAATREAIKATPDVTRPKPAPVAALKDFGQMPN